ncbi:hypothetical protein DY000_02039825 [Brassica cretica]|uniref:Uncharacterized protein n=1 Tax=Brassica cretica TaxID=69181 RepID=A0ABQ7BJ81_BRACR|nr:hypothetical protein DY000_02039825 [Brassica cretica]
MAQSNRIRTARPMGNKFCNELCDHCVIWNRIAMVGFLQMTNKERRTKRRFDRPSSSSASPPPPEMDRDPRSRESEGEPLGTFEHYADPHAAVKDIKCTHREIKDAWDDYDSLFNNEWLKFTIAPTRFIEWATIRRLGLETDLEKMIRKLGLGTMATRPYDLYPDVGVKNGHEKVNIQISVKINMNVFTKSILRKEYF